MQWLLHGPMTSAVGEALKRHKHQIHQIAELKLSSDASPSDILESTQKKQWDILTTDTALAESPFADNQPFSRTIVHLHLEGGDVEQDDAIDRLFERYKRLSPRRLYTVTPTRVKIRQLPGAG
ncbi:MAG TPA: hypothetical protein VGP99_04370 [Tepidisphaeraceae bacterium]|nr:hypothetical protein [Tepidisphaeraceae bacterium]